MSSSIFGDDNVPLIALLGRNYDIYATVQTIMPDYIKFSKIMKIMKIMPSGTFAQRKVK